MDPLAVFEPLRHSEDLHITWRDSGYGMVRSVTVTFDLPDTAASLSECDALLAWLCGVEPSRVFPPSGA